MFENNLDQEGLDTLDKMIAERYPSSSDEVNQSIIFNQVKILLGETNKSVNDDQIALCVDMARDDLVSYIKRDFENEPPLLSLWMRMALVRVQRLNNETLSSQSFSGQSETFIDGYPDDIKQSLKRFTRRVLVL